MSATTQPAKGPPGTWSAQQSESVVRLQDEHRPAALAGIEALPAGIGR